MTNAQSVLQCTLCTSSLPTAMLCSFRKNQKCNTLILLFNKYTKVHHVHYQFFAKLHLTFFELIKEKVNKSSEYLNISEQYWAFRRFLPCAFFLAFWRETGQCTLKIGKYTKVHWLEG